MDVKETLREQPCDRLIKKNSTKSEFKSWGEIMDEEEEEERCRNSKKRSDKNHPNTEKKKRKCNFPEIFSGDISYSVKQHSDYTLFVPVEANKDSRMQESGGRSVLDHGEFNQERSKQRRGNSVTDIKSIKSKQNIDHAHNRYFSKSVEMVKERATSKKAAYSNYVETDEQRLRNREKQIAIGKNTEGYRKYVAEVPRKDRTVDHPWTPDKYSVCSTRSWQGVMRIWRRKLHYWDPPHLVKEFENKKFCNVAAQSDKNRDFGSEDCSLSDNGSITDGSDNLNDFNSRTEEEILFGNSLENY